MGSSSFEFVPSVVNRAASEGGVNESMETTPIPRSSFFPIYLSPSSTGNAQVDSLCHTRRTCASMPRGWKIMTELSYAGLLDTSYPQTQTRVRGTKQSGLEAPSHQKRRLMALISEHGSQEAWAFEKGFWPGKSRAPFQSSFYPLRSFWGCCPIAVTSRVTVSAMWCQCCISISAFLYESKLH